MLCGPILLLLVAVSNAYVYECLDKCECDTGNAIVHCHGGERTKLALPKEGERLRGFHAIAMTFNNVAKLPTEKELIEKFPDLVAVDVQKNPNFDCKTLPEYTRVKSLNYHVTHIDNRDLQCKCNQIVTDCDGAAEIKKVMPLQTATEDCDAACQALRHTDDLQLYAGKLWEVMKEKYASFDKDSTVQQIKTFAWNELKTFLIQSMHQLTQTINEADANGGIDALIRAAKNMSSGGGDQTDTNTIGGDVLPPKDSNLATPAPDAGHSDVEEPIPTPQETPLD